MATSKQKAALAKGREKGKKIMSLAQKLQKEGGKKTVTKSVYKRKMSACVKEAAKQLKRRTA